MNPFNHKYKLNYNKLSPLLASTGGKFSAQNEPVSAPPRRPVIPQYKPGQPLRPERPERPDKKPERPRQTEQPEAKPAPKPERPHISEQPQQEPSRKPEHSRHAARRPATGTSPRIKSRRAKRPPVIIATITGLLLSAIVLLAITGLYGAYCYSQGRHGDASVTASTAMYATAVFVGCFWSAAVVRRQSKLPPIIIGAVFIILSLVISARLFSPADFKLLMIVQKILFTAVAGFAGWALSLIPYLIGRARKRK